MTVYNNPNIQRLSRIFRPESEAPKVKPAQTPERSEPQDSVKLSDEAKIFAAFQRRLAETPEVRKEKVEQLKKAIEAGTYRIPAEKIAEAILREGGLL